MNEIVATTNPEVTQREIDNMALSRALAGECMVLLENNGVLPLANGLKVAVFGSGVRRTIKGGTGSGDVNTRTNINIEQGLKDAGFTITTDAWIERDMQKYAADKAAYGAELEEISKKTGLPAGLCSFNFPYTEKCPAPILPEDLDNTKTDTAIYVLSRNSGEGADRYNRPGDYLPFDEELEQIAAVSACYPKTILVLNIGGVMELTKIKEIPGLDAILLMSQLGNNSGAALVDALLGNVNPSGKLTDTWAKSYSDYSTSEHFAHNDGDVDDGYYTEGIYVGYRYFDTFGIEPLYPFGYGKSYTTFEVGNSIVNVNDGKVTVIAQVTNTGMVAGKEVVQVYVSAPKGNLAKPYQELKGFAKTEEIQPGEIKSVTITFDVASMASYCEKCASWVLEKGDYIIRVGNSSRNTEAAAVITLDETVQTEILKNLFPLDCELEEIKAPECECKEDLSKAVRISLAASTIETKKAVYQSERQEYTTDKTEKLTMDDIKAGRCTVEELVAQLTIEEMASFCVGTLRSMGGSIVGNASHCVPGAAGDSSSICKEDRGIKNMILADGPAGLRLQPVFKTDKEGNLLPGGNVLGDIMEPFDPKYTDENSNTYYQYTTAIPIGWALAMSWNMDLLQRAGDVVGGEMELFNVDLWLAPAMNIHRNPLCGRNFEYYSEDPVVAGKCAAAITLGVQAHPGKGTTIKHFAANSQEDNRMYNNSHISERTIREIYIKGFEITVKESQPLSVMTSYNLLNGIHTANCYDLIQSALRDEWGFMGTVMTDWFTSQNLGMMLSNSKTALKYSWSASTGCVYAGNDMQMPGCQKNVDDLVESATNGTEIEGFKVTKADLQFNTANVIRVASICTTK